MEDVKVLAVVPGTKWKREDVREEYRKLAERIGAPRYLLCDGAIELWEPVDVLEKAGQKPVTLGDMKHHAANVLEKLVGRSERFTSFLTQVGLTRNRIQQTELGHFVPPPLKQKSRFMNLGPLLCWGQMISHHLSRPRSAARQGIDVARMNEKLGWLREYRKDLASWSRCQAVIQTTLEFVNRQGLYRGLADQLHTLLKDKASSWSMRCQTSDELIEKLVGHVSKSESLLAEGQRSWLSTEILESLFGRFKQLEGQHSKGGFTSLLAGLPSLTITWTADRVRASLQSVSVDQMKAWVEQALGRTLTSRRAEAYREFASATFG
jgi:hypothetical protein